ncbi:hypothetical protein BKA93DRAFT_824488 [Sparassis latifolia]|uniref:Uncharacterized protein n=1 Tax=Sparassis crispa TaxID=139825 RepID=A0A401GZF4_9APHY|nr:hypothetical protein SCP_1102090 [Sparassis crispa]GBE87532.1 hypothetical protein SCP_1102090 [Sparassis crispa]
MSTPIPHPSPQGSCRLAELVQYKCELEVSNVGVSQYHCWPIMRIFRICPGRPAVELTRFAEVNADTGEISAPPESSAKLPKGKPWRDIVHNELKGSG